VLGGTPAYRRQFLDQDVPATLDDFDDWLCRTVLSPLSPLFREARYLLAEEADIRETALYHSVLAAVATGNSTRGGIANYIGRKSVDISHALNVCLPASAARASARRCGMRPDARELECCWWAWRSFTGD
jgi:hypothetical protein